MEVILNLCKIIIYFTNNQKMENGALVFEFFSQKYLQKRRY